MTSLLVATKPEKCTSGTTFGFGQASYFYAWNQIARQTGLRTESSTSGTTAAANFRAGGPPLAMSKRISDSAGRNAIIDPAMLASTTKPAAMTSVREMPIDRPRRRNGWAGVCGATCAGAAADVATSAVAAASRSEGGDPTRFARRQSEEADR